MYPISKIKISDLKERIILQKLTQQNLSDIWHDVTSVWAYISEKTQKKYVFEGLQEIEYQYQIVIRNHLSIDRLMRIRHKKQFLAIHSVINSHKEKFITILASEL